MNYYEHIIHKWRTFVELTDLRIFVDVVDSGGITAAANKIHRVPSGITTRIKLLEEELGALLFERIGKKMVLTSDGTLFLEYAKRIVFLANEAVSAVGNSIEQGNLRIGAMDSIAFRFSSELSKYHDTYPSVALSLVSGTSNELIAMVKNGDIDMAITLDPPKDASLCSELIAEDQACLITDLRHPAIKNQSAIGSSSILAFQHGCPYRFKLEEWLRNGNVIPSRIVEIHSYHAMIGCVVAGMGIAIVPESILSGYPKKAGFKTHGLPKKLSYGELRVVYRRAKTNQKYKNLVGFLKKT